MEAVAHYLAAVSLPVGLAMVLLGARRWAGATTVLTFGVAFVVALVQRGLFYRAIRCPRCGHNPNRFKNGKNVPVKAAWTRLAPLTVCPQCGL
jgi:hypothetical protein